MISVVIPNYNKADFIEETISSLAANRVDNVEWIVVDDGSTDKSLESLERLAEKHPELRLFENPGKGGSSARNYGLSKVSGEFVIFLDADDLLASNCISSRLEMINKFPHNDCWVFPMSVFQEAPGDSEQPDWVPREERALESFLCHRLPWQTMQPIWRKEFLNIIGGFDERFPRLQDVELHTKALLQGARVKCFPNAEPDCFYRTSANRISFSAESFQKKFIDGAVLYYNNFFSQLEKEQQKYLAGTLLESMSVLINQLKAGHIESDTFKVHHDRLIACCKMHTQRKLLKSYSAIQVRSPFHIKGLKRITKTLLFL